jgi:hypothetical protein
MSRGLLLNRWELLDLQSGRKKMNNQVSLHCPNDDSTVEIPKSEFTEEEWKSLEPEIKIVNKATKLGWTLDPHKLVYVCPKCVVKNET